MLPRFFLILFLGFFYCQTSIAQLSLSIEGIEEVKGSMFIALYNSEASFLDVEQATHLAIEPVGKTNFSLTFPDLPKGEYAVAVYQDVNENGELDKALFGIPKEPFGFSNDAPVVFGPPKYSDARFEYKAAGAQTIRLKLR